MDDLIGAQVGSIRVVSRLGGGGMGEVYRGFDTKLERPVALKTIRHDRRLSAEFKARFRREARLLSKLGDPGICQIYELIETPDADFLVLEYLEGQTLGAFADSGIARESLLRVFVQLARALKLAHSQRIVHRDLKPENILVLPSGQAKILDFGIARSVLDDSATEASAPGEDDGEDVDSGKVTGKHATTTELVDQGSETEAFSGDTTPVTGAASELTGFGSIVGTRGHMSPEQAAGLRVGTATDIYALGLCLDRLLPKARDSGQRTRAGEDADPAVAALIARMLRGDPKRRPSAADVEAELLDLLDRPRQQARRRRIRIASELGVLALIVVAVVMSALMVEARKANAEAELRRDQAGRMVDYLLGELRDRLSEVGRVELLDGINQRALEYFDAIPAGQATSTELGARVRLLRSLADVRVQRADFDGASALMLSALAGAEARVAEHPQDPIALETLAEIHYWLGYTRLEQLREAELALADFTRGIELRERILQLRRDLPSRLAHATAFTNRSAALQALQRWAESASDLTRAIDVFRATRGEAGFKPKDLGDLATALGWLSSAHEALGDLQAAAAARVENVEILNALSAAEPDNAIWAQDLGIALNFQALLAQSLGADDAALSAMNRSCDLLQSSLERDPANRGNQRASAVCNMTRSGFRLLRGDAEGALTEATAASAALDAMLAAEGAQTDWLLQSALGRLRVAEILAVQKQCARARESIAAMDAILPANPESGYSKTHLARRHLLLARCALQRGEPGQARHAFNAAREVFGAPEAVTGTSALAHLALALLGLDDEAALVPVLERLRARGYRGRLVRDACVAAGRGDCLQ